MTGSGDKPPFGGSWPRIYAGVLVYLAAVIALFTWFTRSWNR